MDIQAIKDKVQVSPAFIVNEDVVINALKALVRLRKACDCKLLYSIKALPLSAVLELVKPFVDGFSVSSLFESRLAVEVLAGFGSIHLTTPGIRLSEIEELTSLCTHISCNSIGQYQRIVKTGKKSVSLGLRINPKLSFTEDSRFDPCRQYSKLGADIHDVINSDSVEQIKGLHFHTVFSATDYTPLIQTLDKLLACASNRLGKLAWLNLGGGYLNDQIDDNEQLIERICQLKNEFDLDVFIEPGNAVVGRAGHLLTTVIDIFHSDGKTIAVLDSTINHHPEVFEYQRQPELFEHDANGDYPVILAGSTCLAGDLFGEYRLAQPLLIGDKLVFNNVGAYSLAKANRFNGYNLPDVYMANTELVKRVKSHTYGHYRQQWMSD